MAGIVRQALHPGTLRRTLRIALVVGTVVSLVNQGSAVAGGAATVSTWIRVVANYVTPFCVSSLTYVVALRGAATTYPSPSSNSPS